MCVPGRPAGAPLEDFRVDALAPLARQRGARGPAQEHLRQPRQHHQTLREGLGLPGDHHGGIGRQGMVSSAVTKIEDGLELIVGTLP
jgi:hypothetical protein